MLPDFPKEKREFEKFWNQYLVNKHRELLGFFATIPSFTIHEGHAWRLERSDGSDSEQPFEELSSEFTINKSDVPDLTPEKIREKLDAVAEDAARQMSQMIIKEIQEAADQVGNTVNAKGQPLTKELFLEMLEKIETGFDEKGEWIPPSIIMHPNAWKANEAKFRGWEQDKEFSDKQTEIINRKREAWYAREALRKLVD
jgi:hypothetical protein